MAAVLFVICLCSIAIITCDNHSNSSENVPNFNMSSHEVSDINITSESENNHAFAQDSDNESDTSYSDNVDEESTEVGEEEVTSCDQHDLTYITRDVQNLTTLMMNTSKISDILQIPRINLTHCVFVNSSEVVLCEVIGIAYDYKPFVYYDFYLRIVITFEIIKNSSGCESACLLRLARVQMEKVDGSYTWDNGTKINLGPTFMIFLLYGSEKMNWVMYFSAEVPSGILYLNSDCARQSRKQPSCIDRVEMIHYLKILSYFSYAYCSEFWDGFKLLTMKVLAGRNSTLTIKSYKGLSRQFFLLYLRDMLNGTGLNSLTLNNMDLKNVRIILQDMTRITYLDLSNNNLDDRKSDALLEAPNVEHLDISSNRFHVIPQEISLLHHLKYLDISRNPIKYTSTNVLSSQANLKWLLLSGTHLNSLVTLRDILRNTSLEGLDISYCNLSSIEDTEFYKQQNLLQSINLSGNNVSVIPPKLFIRLRNLKNISISDLNLTQAPKLELGFGRTLDFIDISRNRLTTPDDVLVSGRIRHLDLSFNLIEVWTDEDMFSMSGCWEEKHPTCNLMKYQKTWVEHLNLSYNVMPTITKTMAKSFANLQSVDIGNNPFNCSNCSIVEFGDWLRQVEDNSSRVNVLSLGFKSDLKCKVDGTANGTSVRNIWSVPDECIEKNYWVTAGTVMGVFLLLFLVVAVVIVRYKFEMAYVMFMLKQKRKRNSLEHKDGFEYDAFVCYSRHDRGWVLQQMVPALEGCAEKFRLCLHERDFTLGSFISLNILQSIQRSRFTVLVLSKAFIDSQWCRWELEVANHKLFETGRELLILIQLERLNEETVPRHLKFLMDTRTYLEWPEKGGDTATAWKRLRKSLGKSIYQQELEASPK